MSAFLWPSSQKAADDGGCFNRCSRRERCGESEEAWVSFPPAVQGPDRWLPWGSARSHLDEDWRAVSEREGLKDGGLGRTGPQGQRTRPWGEQACPPVRPPACALSTLPPTSRPGPVAGAPRGRRPLPASGQTPRGPAVFVGQAEQTARRVCPHVLPPALPPAWPDYLNMVEAPGPPQRLHPPPPTPSPDSCTRSWGRGAESQTGKMGCFPNSVCGVRLSYGPPTLDLAIPFPEVQPRAVVRGPSRAGWVFVTVLPKMIGNRKPPDGY